jgi:transposase
MEIMERNKPRARRLFTPEFKAEIVELCQRGDRSIGRVARDFDLTETAVREWVRQAERDSVNRSDGGLTGTERHELAALRRENQRLRGDVEILKRATAFFALVSGSLAAGGVRSFFAAPACWWLVPMCGPVGHPGPGGGVA